MYMKTEWHDHIILHTGVFWKIIHHTAYSKVLFIISHNNFTYRVLVAKKLMSGCFTDHNGVVAGKRLVLIAANDMKIKYRKKRRVGKYYSFVAERFFPIFIFREIVIGSNTHSIFHFGQF